MHLLIYIAAIAAFSRCSRALCPPTGPVLPPPLLSNDTWDASALVNAVASFIQSSQSNLETTFFSVSVTSKDGNIFSYQDTPKTYNKSGTNQATGSSVQRVASVTKLFTVLAVLIQDDMNLEDAITQYVPELAAQERWQAVTLRMLAAHFGGVARDVPIFDLALTAPLPFEKLGFPPLNSSELPHCTGDVSQPLCSKQQWFDILLEQDFVWLPGDRAAYSDLGFILLGYALENATSQAFSDIIKDTITTPLGLKDTGFDAPSVSDAIIPQDTPWFGLDIGNYKKAAGLYSTPDDLCAFFRGLLNGHLISKARLRDWLKPAIFTSSPCSAVGMPWEIFRVADSTPQGRLIDIYSKDGDLPAPGGYAAHVALIPEYDVGLVITGAGDYAFEVSTELFNRIGGILITELDDLARKQADSSYAGRYVATDGNGTETEIVLGIDRGPGIAISKWMSNGANMLQSLAQISGDGSNASAIDARIYPIGEDERWRLQIESVSAARSVWDGPITGQGCRTWSDVDKLRYGMLPVDDFTFETEQEADGYAIVKGLKLVGLREHLDKVA